MFCKNCGQEINDLAIICPSCGVATDNLNKTAPVPEQKNTLALIGFILSFFVPLVGLILSIMGYQNAKKPEYNGDGKSFALAGIIISAIEMAVCVIVVIIYFVVIISVLGALPGYYYW